MGLEIIRVSKCCGKSSILIESERYQAMTVNLRFGISILSAIEEHSGETERCPNIGIKCPEKRSNVSSVDYL